MAHDDGAEAKIAAAVAVTALLFSPRMREVIRHGAVHGLAAVLTASDAIAAFARGVSRGVQESVTPDAGTAPAPSAVTRPSAAEAGPASVPSSPHAGSPGAARPPRRARTPAPNGGRTGRRIGSQPTVTPTAAPVVLPETEASE